MSDLPRVALACDHAGFLYKEAIKEWLSAKGYPVEDFGTHSAESVDYPDFIPLAAEAVADGRCELGVVLGGSGNGEAITANKVKGIRCGLCWDVTSARLTKEHNNANVISIGQRMVSREMALDIVETWLNATYEGGRHQRRVEKLAAYEAR